MIMHIIGGTETTLLIHKWYGQAKDGIAGIEDGLPDKYPNPILILVRTKHTTMHSHSLPGVGNAMGQRHHDWREHVQVNECFKQNEPPMVPDILAGIEILHDCVPPPPAAGLSNPAFSNLSQSHCDQEFQSQKTQDTSSELL